MNLLAITPSGLIKDQPPSSLEPDKVSECANIDFFTGRPRSRSQLSSIGVPLQPPVRFGFYEYAGIRRWAWGSATGLVCWDGTNQANVLPVTHTGSAYWDTDAFNGFGLFTNGIPPQAPLSLDASQAFNTPAVPLPGWPVTWSCKLIRAHRNYLLAINTVESGISHPTRVRWSESAVAGALPAGWTPTSGNDAGAYDPSVPGGEIIDTAALGDTVFLGGRGGLWMMTYIGGTFGYRFEQRSISHGVRGPECIVSMGDSVAVLTQTDVVQIDSTSERSLAIGRVAKNLFSTIGQRAKLVYNDNARQLLVLYGVGIETGYSHVLVWDRDTDTWGTIILAAPIDDLGKGLNNSSELESTYDDLAGKYTYDTWTNRGYYDRSAYSSDNNFYLGGTAAALLTPGTEYGWMLQRTDLRPVPGNFARVFSLRAIVDGVPGQTIRMRIGSSQAIGEPVAWGAQRAYVLGTDELWHHDIQRGALISYELNGNGNCTISSLEMEWQQQGRSR